MASSTPDSQPSELGTFIYENWRAALSGHPVSETLEYPLFSDAQVAGEIRAGLGPYQLLNCIADPSIDPHRPVLALRIEYHVRWSYGQMEATDAARYHGAGPSDELAALLSLSLGMRLKSGSANRWFPATGDPRGRPWSFREAGRPDPSISRSAWGLILPHAPDQRQLDRTPRLERFADLLPRQSVAVVRAARLYQDAVWIAESEPALSWLMLVSAVETAAVEWRRQQDEPTARLRESQPELYGMLEEHGGQELATRVAEMLVDSLGVTKKFVDFCLTYLPPAPPIRPPEENQVPWDESALRRELRTIYRYRSKALHEGIPFPGPMCMPPHISGASHDERPPGSAAGTMGAVWVRRDLPMYLHVFERIARGALLSWWDSLISIPALSDE